MKHLTLDEKYKRIRNACETYDSVCCGASTNTICSVGIHNYGLLHYIADALGMKNNSGGYLHSLNARITKIMRELIAAGYPIKEYKIKCCSWSPKETWHPLFKFEKYNKEN